jgi:hypothetical protein
MHDEAHPRFVGRGASAARSSCDAVIRCGRDDDEGRPMVQSLPGTEVVGLDSVGTSL